ncbi:signal recognition particle subunit srp68 [Fusarium sporotrichioides]|uniref:Signal recognition particle subunit srp68 n=1 Tax=Fusarium sporotrichioides TaxID=5514 RepID=A0A395SKS3_FUSSP|nr:signal recognition particle subunit srp68 [Fusarium sporotrichioides]
MDQVPVLNSSLNDGQLESSTSTHPYPATVIAFVFILIVVSLFISILRQLLERRLSQRRGWFLNTTYPPPSPAASSSGGSSRRSKKAKEQKGRPISECEIESRQLLFPDASRREERVPLRNPDERGSLYDTFQLPGPHASKLKPARSMMELNGGSPLEGMGEKEGQKKAKTIHWHGVNRLNTAWGWMS